MTKILQSVYPLNCNSNRAMDTYILSIESDKNYLINLLVSLLTLRMSRCVIMMSGTGGVGDLTILCCVHGIIKSECEVLMANATYVIFQLFGKQNQQST